MGASKQIFKSFDPYSPPIGSFLQLSISKFGQFLTPPPLNNATSYSYLSNKQVGSNKRIGWNFSSNIING